MSRRSHKRRSAPSVPRAADSPTSVNSPRHPRNPTRQTLWLLLPPLIAATALAYHPAWHGGLLWDDDGHLTPSDLQSAAGLWRIWFVFGATQQYYPVAHTAFWILHRLVGDNTLGYHFVNVVLHAVSAFLLAVVLRRLRVPGAMLAAAMFALHPVEVESVAWMTELKNVLSGVFYLLALLAYLRFDAERRWSWYAAACALFVLALGSKTVAATLPVGLLVVFWWQRGRIDWRRDVQPLLPFVIVGGAAGLLTSWVEHTFIGARGPEFDFTIVQRVLIAGRAAWFYLGRIVWPANLIFIYPKWTIDGHVWWQYLYPAALVALVAGLWAGRARSRAPFAALAWFLVTVAPALGFVSVFPFRYSFVADHFQYLALIAPITLASAGLATLARRVPPQVFVTGSLALVSGLGALTWRQSGEYVDGDTLYRATIAKNPECWMAYNNLGTDLQRAGRVAEAEADYRAALAINPDSEEAHRNLGLALEKVGQPARAAVELEEAIRIQPASAQAHEGLGAAWQQLGRLEDAAAEFREALRLTPEYAGAESNLGATLEAKGQIDEAIAHYEASLAIDPNVADVYLRLANALAQRGRTDEAVAEYESALRIDPSSVEATNNLGVILEGVGRPGDAVAYFTQAVRLRPDSSRAETNLGRVLGTLHRDEEAVIHLENAARLDPSSASAHRTLANVLQQRGSPVDAVREYREALRYEPDSPETHNNLGVALNSSGHPTEAVVEFEAALKLKPDYVMARSNLQHTLAALRSGR